MHLYTFWCNEKSIRSPQKTLQIHRQKLEHPCISDSFREQWFRPKRFMSVQGGFGIYSSSSDHKGVFFVIWVHQYSVFVLHLSLFLVSNPTVATQAVGIHCERLNLDKQLLHIDDYDWILVTDSTDPLFGSNTVIPRTTGIKLNLESSKIREVSKRIMHLLWDWDQKARTLNWFESDCILTIM